MPSKMFPGNSMLFIAALTAAATLSFGQASTQGGAVEKKAATAAPQSFEVASIKPSAESGARVMVGISPGGRYTASAVNV